LTSIVIIARPTSAPARAADGALRRTRLPLWRVARAELPPLVVPVEAVLSFGPLSVEWLRGFGGFLIETTILIVGVVPTPIIAIVIVCLGLLPLLRPIAPGYGFE